MAVSSAIYSFNVTKIIIRKEGNGIKNNERDESMRDIILC